MHWLILVPVYFFAAISFFAVLHIAARALRLEVDADALATGGGFISLILLGAVFVLGIVSIEAVTLVPILGLMALSFFLAGLDMLVVPVLPSNERDHGTPRPQVT